jgi:hypothetical protein
MDMDEEMPRLSDGGAHCSIKGAPTPAQFTDQEKAEMTDAKNDIYKALLQCSGKGGTPTETGGGGGAAPISDFGGTIRDLTLLDIVELPNTYSIIRDPDAQSMDTMCMVKCDSLLWKFLDYITGTEDMMVLLREACGSDKKEIFGLSITPIRQMAVSRRKSGARMTVGVPLELVQGAVAFLNTKFMMTCQEKANDGNCPDTDKFANYVDGRRETLEKMSFRNFTIDMFANYLDLIHCEEEYKRRLCVIFEKNPDAVKGVFEVITEMSFGGKMLLEEKRVLSRARKELITENGGILPEKVPLEEEPMTDDDAVAVVAAPPKSKLLCLLLSTLDDIEKMSTGEDKISIHQVIRHTKKVAQLKGSDLSTPENRGVLHAGRGFRHTYLVTLLSEAILVALTLYGLDNKQLEDPDAMGASPLFYLLATASTVIRSVDEQDKPVML